MYVTETIILYHAYGSQPIYNKVVFSILSLHYHVKGNYNNLKVIVYTDKPQRFQQLAQHIPLVTETLSSNLISNYKGQNNFVHRVKICIINDCINKYKSNIFYLDSDTYFTKEPTPLFAKIDAHTSIMNSNDYDLLSAEDVYENKDWLLIRRAIRGFDYTIENERVRIPLTTRMWNAGVIGLSHQNKNLIPLVLDLADQIYSNKQVFTAEQFAFSYILQNKTNLYSSEDVIFHYWQNYFGKYWKNSYDYHLKKFFAKNRSNTIEQKALLAYELTLNHDELMKLPRKTIAQKLLTRMRLMIRVALTGKTA